MMLITYHISAGQRTSLQSRVTLNELKLRISRKDTGQETKSYIGVEILRLFQENFTVSKSDNEPFLPRINWLGSLPASRYKLSFWCCPKEHTEKSDCGVDLNGNSIPRLPLMLPEELFGVLIYFSYRCSPLVVVPGFHFTTLQLTGKQNLTLAIASDETRTAFTPDQLVLLPLPQAISYFDPPIFINSKYCNDISDANKERILQEHSFITAPGMLC